MENGLELPDDVTIVWCDDNYGYMTRLPDSVQQKRSGGHGVYYHLSYCGRPHDHLWLSTMQPGLVYEQMRLAYDNNVRKVWIANVHDPKVAAYDLELFLDMAWDIDCVEPQSVDAHLASWLEREYGREASELLTPALKEFYRLYEKHGSYAEVARITGRSASTIGKYIRMAGMTKAHRHAVEQTIWKK